MSEPYYHGLGKRVSTLESDKTGEEGENTTVCFSAGGLSDVTATITETIPTSTKKRRGTHLNDEIIPKFDPGKKSTNVKGWLRKIDQLGDLYGWDERDKIFSMKNRLRGEAREWYDDLEDHGATWNVWKERITKAFPRSTDFVDRLEEMLSRKKTNDETMTRYYHDKMYLMKKCYLEGEAAISCLIRGLPIEMRSNAKAYSCETPEELYNGFLSSLENFKEVEKATDNRSTLQRGSASNIMPKICYNCCKTGHESRECEELTYWEVSMTRCQICQSETHTTTACWYAAGSSGAGTTTSRTRAASTSSSTGAQQILTIQRPQQHGVHAGGQSVGPCGWYSSSAAPAPAPTAPARSKRAQPPHLQLPSGGVLGGSNGPHAPLSPTAMQNSVSHNSVMSSSVRAPAPAGPAPVPAMHTSQTAPAVATKGSSDVLVNSSSQPPCAGNRLVNMTQWPWHHGAISRERAEALLSGSPDGVFLVRESTNFPGDHTLCVRFRGRVEHYRIKWATAPDSQNQRLTIDDEEFFENMTDLIHHYLKDADGLCTRLVRCLPKMAPNGANNNGQPPYPPHPQQPPPYPPTPAVAGHFPPAPAPAHDAVDAALAPPVMFLDARWTISERDLEIRENIGKGEFGDVMLGILNGTKVAVKILKDKEAASKFQNEATVMASLKHENLVRLLGLAVCGGSPCLVTEHCAQGSLLDYLRSRGRHYVTQADQIHFAYDTCCGMEHLERLRVVHRDVAARNVLVAASGAAKVADFGLARQDHAVDDPADQARLQAKLPIKWTAPEALKYNKFSNKSDMWSFGILLWEIYSFGRVPYPRIPLAEVVRHVERGYRMEAPEGCPPRAYELMRAAWHVEPAQRPAFCATRRALHAERDAVS